MSAPVGMLVTVTEHCPLGGGVALPCSIATCCDPAPDPSSTLEPSSSGTTTAASGVATTCSAEPLSTTVLEPFPTTALFFDLPPPAINSTSKKPATTATAAPATMMI